MSKISDMLTPDMFLEDIYTLNLDKMKTLGIEAFVFDIDNTLVTYDDAYAPEHTKKWFETLHKNGFKTYLVSNNNSDRVKLFAESLGERYYANAFKPRKKYLRLACRDMGVDAKHTALAGDQLFTDIYGGKRMGMYTIFVRAISDKENWFVHFKRYLERAVMRGGKYEL